MRKIKEVIRYKSWTNIGRKGRQEKKKVNK